MRKYKAQVHETEQSALCLLLRGAHRLLSRSGIVCAR